MNTTAATAKTAATTTRHCLCGCGGSTSSSKTFYRPGHDARHISNLLVNVRIELKHLGQAVKATDEGLAALPSDKLKHKFLAAAQRAEAKQPADRKPKSDQVEAIAETEAQPLSKVKGEPVEAMWDEEDQAPAEELFEVKIGRWTYPAKHLLGMDVRNTKRDGSGEWIPYES